MKFTCFQEDILKGIQSVQYIVESKTTLPILLNILLEAKDKEVVITSTDLDVGIKTSFPAKVEKKGISTVPAKRFSEIVHGLPDDDIDVELMGNNSVGIRCGSISFTLNTLNPEDFPKFPSHQKDKHFLIPAQLLRKMITRTIFSVSHDETRYVLNGILVEKEKNEIKLIATNSHRLALTLEKIKEDTSGKFKIIVPFKTMREVARLLTGENKDIKVIIEEKQIIFFIDKIILISRIIDGQFPDYKKVVPDKKEISFNVGREKVLQATKRISILTSSKSTAVIYQLKPKKLNIYIRNPEEGEAQEIIDIEYDGPEMEIGYNYRYLLDIYKNLDCEELSFEFTKPLHPGLIKPKGGENPIYIIMPMRI